MTRDTLAAPLALLLALLACKRAHTDDPPPATEATPACMTSASTLRLFEGWSDMREARKARALGRVEPRLELASWRVDPRTPCVLVESDCRNVKARIAVRPHQCGPDELWCVPADSVTGWVLPSGLVPDPCADAGDGGRAR